MIGQRLKSTRLQAGYSRRTMAIILNTSRKAIKQIEKGLAFPSVSILRAWKSRFNQSYNYIIEGAV